MAEPVIHQFSMPLEFRVMPAPRIHYVTLRATTRFNALLPDGTLSAERMLTEDELAVILDLGDQNSRQTSTWISGPPEPSFWTGLKMKGKHQREIRTFRCVRCGFLESYAW